MFCSIATKDCVPGERSRHCNPKPWHGACFHLERLPQLLREGSIRGRIDTGILDNTEGRNNSSVQGRGLGNFFWYVKQSIKMFHSVADSADRYPYGYLYVMS